MRYGVVKDSFWTDPRVEGLTRDAKFVFLHFLTCPEMTITGLVTVTIGVIGYRLGIDTPSVRVALSELEESGVVESDYDRMIFWVVNKTKHDPPKGPKQIAGWRKCLEMCDSPLKDRVWERYRYIIEGVSLFNDTPIIHPDPDPDPSSVESSTLLVARGLCLRLIARMIENNPKSKAKVTDAWAQDMEKLIRIDQRHPDDVANVIDWCQADDFWKTNILSPLKLRKHYDKLDLRRKSQPKAKSKAAVRDAFLKRGES